MQLARVRRTGSPPACQRGFTLLEVLIALLVTSIGLLGLAAMQLTAIKQNHNAYLRAQAVEIAHQIAEDMRANRAAALAGAYNLGLADAAPAGGSVADADLSAWRTRLAQTLPDGEGAVTVNAANATALVQVRWNDARGQTGPENPAPGDPLEFRMSTQL